MCLNLKFSDLSEVKVYKVVIEKDGKYFSPFTMVEYPKDGPCPTIPEDSIRRELSTRFEYPAASLYFKRTFVYPALGNRPGMIGYTSGFVRKEQANRMLSSIQDDYYGRTLMIYTIMDLPEKIPFDSISVKRYLLYGSIMEGVAFTSNSAHRPATVFLGTNMKLLDSRRSQ